MAPVSSKPVGSASTSSLSSAPQKSSYIMTLYNIGDSSVKRIMPIANSAKDLAVAGLVTSKAVLDKYPPIKAFVYTLAATSAIPLAVFAGFAGATLTGALAVAGTGVAVVQGGFLAFGGFILFFFLAGAFIVTSIATFWFTAAYFAFQVAKSIEGRSA
ncbi:hypothetical protein HDU76_003749 [Blyttiomyces sp. JEL0837]|nr:hypothetical protein HDU76_003749 [Blyttiomyces sp. JEL0837]